MNKKGLVVIFSLLVTLFIGWFFYRSFNSSQSDLIIESNINNKSPDSKNPPSLKIVNLEKFQDEKKQSANEALSVDKKTTYSNDDFESFDKLEKEWGEEVHGIMGDDNYQVYQDMKSRNEKEKMQAYKEYHEYLRKKHGDNFSYNISEDQSIREKSINQRYLKELLKVIGESKFIEYTAAKDQFNEKMRRNKKESIQFEF